MKRTITQRILSALVCVAMLLAYLPGGLLHTSAATQSIYTVADPQTLTRPGTIYGDNTLHAGKITVGKSVSNTGISVNGEEIALEGLNNFLVTISQSAQVMGLSSQTSLPVDVVFVLDTSGSMADNDRSGKLVTAANAAIASLMKANEQNRVGVVAFSSDGYGDGTSGDNAASVLSSLAHYTGDAATNHLQWVNNRGVLTNGGSYVAGRDEGTITYTERQRVNGRWQEVEITANVNNFRHAENGGTNVQAGIVLASSLLTSVQDTTWTNPATGATIHRIPFLVVISDGQPTYISSESDWYAPEGSGQVGSGSGAYEGNGFVTALTAAYYKGKITEHYYGADADADKHCFVYTMGVEIAALDGTNTVGDNESLAQITLDPSKYTTGDYATENAVSYYRYGNTWDETWALNRSTDNSFMTYWSNFQKGDSFSVRVNERNEYTFTAESIAAAKPYVNGIGYTGGLTYNDDYFAADDVSQMNRIFDALITAISKKAMSAPTKVTTGDHDFDGYVNFYDPIGAYMEVKDMKGLLAGGYFYQGASFAQKLSVYGTENADTEFDAMLRKVLKTRMGLSSADDRFASEEALDTFIDELLSAAAASGNQASYTDADNFDNSFVWWGSAYDSGEEDEHVQLIGFADNDSVDYIEQQRTDGTIPADADYVCRSYFFYGEAGGANPNPNHEYLYFVVRVQRELTAPYRQTVVISAPASLLSMEKVLITESFDDSGNPTYTATVEHQEPARVVYEVGLWDTITPENVSLIVSSGYANATVNGEGSVNYDPATGIYNFFTNEWDRSQNLESHHRAEAKATFDAAADNAFYTYQADTLIVDAQGNPVTENPLGTTAYYLREYYTWEDGDSDGTYTAVKTNTLIEVDIPADATLISRDGQYYIPKGTYTAATLVVNGDDTMKEENATGTSSIVAHPHRTGDASNSHYTVLLGNNGMLSMVSEPYTPGKDVSITGADGTIVTDANGKAVQVGDVLTYTIEAQNVLTETADITVTDYVPNGTAFVEGSATDGVTPDSNNVLTWVLEDVPAGQTRTVSFRVTVLPAALSLNVVSGTIQNTAQVRIGNTPAISTNPTYNPPYGKTVSDPNGAVADGEDGYKVGDILVYHIRVTNNAVDADGNFLMADVTVTDIIPEGTEYVEGSADNGGVYANGMITWQFNNMAPGAATVVSFRVRITADAKAGADGTQPESGEIAIENAATIEVENNPTITTNTTVTKVALGDMVITKVVADGGDNTRVFTINLTESTGNLNGTYVLDRDGVNETVTFVDGKASVTIMHGQKLTIKGLPVGTVVNVAEDTTNLPGWTPTYNTRTVTITEGAATTVSSVSVTNTYTLEPLTLSLKGVKNMSGSALAEPMTFGFVATPDSANPEVGDPLTGQVTVDGNGAFTFTMSSKTFTKPGVYRYTITEINGGALGVNYDGTVHVLQLNILDNGDGTMGCEATLNGNAFNMANGAVPFSNNYTPEDTTLVFAADKRLSGRELTAGEFSFVLTDGTNSYRGINDANGNIVFETIRFTTPGTYVYTLSEVIPSPKAQGVTYDTDTYTVVATVTDEGGRLTTAVTINGKTLNVENGIVDTGVLFENTFVPDDVALTITAKKTLLVYDATAGGHVNTKPEANRFHFRIVDENGNTVATGTNDAEGNVRFDTIYLSAELLSGVQADADGNRSKVLTYTISEEIPTLSADPDMKYDATAHQIQVLLTHTADGKLVVSVNGDTDGYVDLTDSANFVNYGNPDSVSVTPVGVKTTVGDNLPAGLSFSFKVVPVGGSVDAAIGTSDATTGGANSETTHITFGSLTYTRENLGGAASATFDYWIMESNASAGTVTGSNGVTYDTTRYLYRVTLTTDATTGMLKASESYFALNEGGDATSAADYTVQITGANVTFTNTYAAKTHVNLTADKVLSGRNTALKAGEFEFVLQRLDASGKIIEASHITGTNDANGVIHFATLNYSNEMLDEAYFIDGAYYFSYLMRELKPEGTAVPGVTYDTTGYIVTIKVTQDNENGMSAVLAGVSLAVQTGDSYAPGTPVASFTAAGDTNVTFTNTYSTVEGDVVRYRIRKDLQGRRIRAGEFVFGLYLDGQQVATATNDANGIVTFERVIPASAAAHTGTYAMVIREEKGSLTGVTYSTAEFPIFVKITDTGSGKLEATVHLTADGPAVAEDATGTVDLTDVFVFTNTYEAHDTAYTPVAGKVLTGRTQIAGEFSFQAQLIHDGNAVTDGAIYQGVNDANGNILFQAIPFTDAGTYIFKITERKGTVSGVTYDSSAYYLKVMVSDDGNGHLKTAATYYTDEACTNVASAVQFRNAYVPSSVPVQLVGNKTLTGRPLQDKEFNFLVYKAGDTTHPVASGTNDANGNILFSTFSITAADMMDAAGNFVAERTFTYTIVESDNKHPGVTYAAPVNVTVTVTNTNGVFTAVVNYPEGTAAQFVNVYAPNSVSVPLVAYKTLRGKNMQAFEFVLTTPDGTETTVFNDANGIAAFGNLTFTAEDMVDENGNKVMEKTFVYTLTEKAGTMAGMIYDKSVYTITVTVTDDGEGNLTARTTYADDGQSVDVIRFVNSYTPPSVAVELEGTKTIVDAEGNVLTGPDFPVNVFTFQVYDVDGNLVGEANSDENGNIKLTGLRFTEAGEYRFTVKEKASAKPGYTADATVWCVHITIGYNADTGMLYEESEYIHIAPETHDEVAVQVEEGIAFLNRYDAEDVQLIIKGLKKLEGRPLREHEFTFYMVDNATGLRAAESRNHGNGEIHFSLHYSKAGTYTYTVYEQIPADPSKLHGVTYTTKTHQVTVEVIDDGTGALKAKVGDITVLGSGDVDMTDSVIFTNIYSPDGATATVEAVKHLEGKRLEAGKYTFELVSLNDPNVKYTALNQANGKVVFEPLTFTAEDMVDENGNKVMEKVFTYQLCEVAGTEPGVTYDASVYTVTVTVTDDGYGQLSTAVTYTKSSGETVDLPDFRNVYKASAVTYTPEVTKIFEGGEMMTFDFVLTGEGFATQIKQNNAEGNVTFDALTFVAAGRYTFTIHEQVNESYENVKWDTNVYTLVIEVADPGDGQLEIAQITITGKNGRNDLIFRNVLEELVTRKDVFVGDTTVSVDGQTVKTGDILTYVITYKNYTGFNANVTITDWIPAHTTYVEGSADNGGIFADGTLTWNFTDVAPDATVTVSFRVEVTGTNVAITNQSQVLEGENTYQSNTVTTFAPEDKVEKDGFLKSDPTISIDGAIVKKGDTLVYTITYHNSVDAAADVTITDRIPQYTAYVEGSADNGGIFADGVLTWNLHLDAGESLTVSFEVVVTGAYATITNQATAVEAGNELQSNVVTTATPDEPPKTGDETSLMGLMGIMTVSALGVVVMLAAAMPSRKRKHVNEA